MGDGDHSAYAVCDHGHHYHVVCTGCGQVLHVDECPVEPLLGELEARTGFRVENHRLEIAGLCRVLPVTESRVVGSNWRCNIVAHLTKRHDSKPTE